MFCEWIHSSASASPATTALVSRVLSTGTCAHVRAATCDLTRCITCSNISTMDQSYAKTMQKNSSSFIDRRVVA